MCWGVMLYVSRNARIAALDVTLRPPLSLLFVCAVLLLLFYDSSSCCFVLSSAYYFIAVSAVLAGVFVFHHERGQLHPLVPCTTA